MLGYISMFTMHLERYLPQNSRMNHSVFWNMVKRLRAIPSCALLAASLLSPSPGFAEYRPGMIDLEGLDEWERLNSRPNEAYMLQEAGVTRGDARGFHLICAVGAAKQVAEALADGADPNQADAERGGQHPIIDAAARNPDPEVIRLLLQAGADPNVVGKVYNRTPLFQAVIFNPNPGPVIKALIDGGADLRHGDIVPHSILQAAVTYHFDREQQQLVTKPRDEAVLALLKGGADVTFGAGRNFNALGIYLDKSDHPNLKVVQAMFDAGANPTHRIKTITNLYFFWPSRKTARTKPS